MRKAILLLLAALVSELAFAAEKKPLTIEDVWSVARVGDPVLSPDGKRVVYAVSVYDMEENRSNADLWLSAVSGGPPRRLTAHKASDSSPAWSPDGRRLAFASKRDADSAAQLYVLPLDGGEAERITEMPLAVSDPRWLPDGKRIVFVSHVLAGSEAPDETKKALDAREKSKVKARTTENRLFRYWDRWLTDGEYPHFFVVDLETRKVTDLLPGSKRYFDLQEGTASYDVSPDGSQIVFQANSTPEPYRTLNSDLFLLPTAGGEPRNLTADNPAEDSDPLFSPDGRRIAYGLERKADGYPDRTRLAVLDLSGGRTTALTEEWKVDVSTADWEWTRDGKSLVFAAAVRGRTNLYAMPASGGVPREIWRGGTASGPRVTPAGEVVFSYNALTRPAELGVVPLAGGNLRELTSVNASFLDRIDWGEVRDLTFAGADGDPVQMFVVLPPGFDSKRRYPLVHLIHGGPIGIFGDSFSYRWNPQVFAGPGYVVAMVNFHGSSSFGQKWVASILGAHPDKPFTDVMKGTDFLIAQGYVDENRMAAAGGSYGGFLVNWIEGHTDRFRALVSHAGVYSLLGQSASDAYYGRHHSYGAYPFTDLEKIEKWSPNRFAKNFRTPMLVIHGERDFRVPVGQGLELYGVLTTKGVPARLVYYPDENHWILKGQNSRHWYGEVLGWLARYLDPSGAAAGAN